MENYKKNIQHIQIKENYFMNMINSFVIKEFMEIYQKHQEKYFMIEKSILIISLFRIPNPIDCENITQDKLNDLSNYTYFI